MNTSVDKLFGIYVHIPFCVKKCSYCDFNSFAAGEDIYSVYTDAVCAEIEADTIIPDDYMVDTVFFGGGTPSVVPPFLINKILCKLKEKYTFVEKPEISLEMNPGTATLDKLIEYKNMGINRLSIGMQSLNNQELKTLGRIHTSKECEATVAMARQAGFENVSLDLMNQIPGQTPESFMASLKRALALNPKHISCYSLILEEGTLFWELYENGKLQLPDEDDAERIDKITDEELEKAGYHRYEISNFAKEGYESRHNMSYWRRVPYRGYGLSASSLLEFEGRESIRFTAEIELDKYLENANKPLEERFDAQEFRRLNEDEKMEEFIFLGLRTTKGINTNEFEKRFDKNFFSEYSEQLKKYIDMGLMCVQDDEGDRWLKFSKKGLFISNPILADFLK